jgi:hypothetical protein
MSTVVNSERDFLAYQTSIKEYLLVSAEVEKQLKNSAALSAIQGRFLMLLQQCNDFSVAVFLLKHEHNVAKSSQLAIGRCLLDAVMRVEYYRCYGKIADDNVFHSDAASSKTRFTLLGKNGYVLNPTEAEYKKINDDYLKTKKTTMGVMNLKTEEIALLVQKKFLLEERKFDAHALYITYREMSAAAHSDLIFLSDKHLNGRSISQNLLYKYLTDLLTAFTASLKIFLAQNCLFPEE